MTPNQIARGALRLAAVQPSTWLSCAVLLSIWPALSTIAPIGISQHSAEDSASLYELAIVSLGLGSMRGVAAAARIYRSIALGTAASALAVSALVLGPLALLHALIALSPALWLGHFPSEPAELELGLRLALVLLILVAIGGMLLRLDRLTGSAPWILGISFLLASALLPHPLPTRSLGCLAPGLLWAAWLLDHPPGRAD